MRLLNVLKSKYCWIVISLSLVLGYFLVLKDFNELTDIKIVILGISFVILFSFSNACLIKDIVAQFKEKSKLKTESYISIFASILGYGALQTCSVGYVCTTPVLLAIFPASIVSSVIHSSIWFLLFSNILLFYSVFRMRCFRK